MSDERDMKYIDYLIALTFSRINNQVHQALKRLSIRAIWPICAHIQCDTQLDWRIPSLWSRDQEENDREDVRLAWGWKLYYNDWA